MIKLKKEMIEAIAAAVEEAGSQMEFQRKTGIRQSTINKILNQKSVSITDRTWRDLLPYLGGNPVINNGHNTGVMTGVNQGLSDAIDKILAADTLTDEEKVKVLKVLKK